MTAILRSLKRDASRSAALPITEDPKKAVLSLMDNAGIYVAGDPNVIKIVTEEAAKFFNKEKSAKDAVAMMQNRVTTYLNE